MASWVEMNVKTHKPDVLDWAMAIGFLAICWLAVMPDVLHNARLLLPKILELLRLGLR